MTVPYTFATQSGNVPASELDANFASVANNVSSANTALTAGTVTTNAQPNITSVGTLTSVSVVGNVTANLFVGDITGSIANATYATTAGFASTAGTANSATTATTATSATTAGTVTTAAQPNITSVGTLTSLSVSGNINAGNVIATNLSGPIFASYSTANIALVNSSATVLKYNGIRTNTNSYYNTSTGQFTPLTAGWYQVNAAMLPQYVSGTQQISATLALYKNGNIIAVGPATTLTSTWGTITNSSVGTLVNLNGSTDWIGIAVIVTTSTGVWQVGISESCYFQACWIRGA